MASFPKNSYQPDQTSPVLASGNVLYLHLDSVWGWIGKKLSPDTEFLSSLADKQTPLPPVYCVILVRERGSNTAPADLPSSTLSRTSWPFPETSMWLERKTMALSVTG